MKRIAIIAVILAMVTMATMAEGSNEDPNRAARQDSLESAINARSAIPVPSVSYFQERRTIAAWTERWDRPNVPTYVYLVSYGVILGYYVADGKPASTRSYLIPEESVMAYTNWGLATQAPDIDGTYGDNNPGIRFFTADGTAVEWGGSGAAYLYSDAPLPINVPKLNVVVSVK